MDRAPGGEAWRRVGFKEAGFCLMLNGFQGEWLLLGAKAPGRAEASRWGRRGGAKSAEAGRSDGAKCGGLGERSGDGGVVGSASVAFCVF